MSTATVEQERLVAAPEDHVLFMSRRSELRLVKTPRYPIHGPSGQKVGEAPGEALAFRDGTLRVPLEGSVRLEDGREVPAGPIREWLEQHKLFTDREDGFWRIDPVAPPISREEFDAMMDLVLELDAEKLEALIEQERAGWNREDLLASAERSLARVKAALEAAAAGQAPEAEE